MDDDKDCCPTGDGGNSTITNQDEMEILARTTAGMTVRIEGYQAAEPQR
ncbi:hypothetical protein ACIO1C_29650 [Streptomyces sp. NPDC087420]